MKKKTIKVYIREGIIKHMTEEFMAIRLVTINLFRASQYL